MDVGRFSMAMAQNELASQVSLAVFKMAKDVAAENGEKLVDMIESAPAPSVPGVGANIDVRL